MKKLSKFYWTREERCKAYGLYIKLRWKHLMPHGTFENFMEVKYDGRFDKTIEK
jgi:hypothetical protein